MNFRNGLFYFNNVFNLVFNMFRSDLLVMEIYSLIYINLRFV